VAQFESPGLTMGHPELAKDTARSAYGPHDECGARSFRLRSGQALQTEVPQDDARLGRLFQIEPIPDFTTADVDRSNELE
jgi:hypothetical protein